MIKEENTKQLFSPNVPNGQKFLLELDEKTANNNYYNSKKKLEGVC